MLFSEDLVGLPLIIVYLMHYNQQAVEQSILLKFKWEKDEKQ